jgi:biopolymer transport protein ExbD
MAMNVGSGGGDGDPEVMIDVNTTPLIDVMLVLIVMLIITIPIQTHAVKLNMPVGNPPPPLTPPEVITVEVDFDGTVLWNGDVVPDRPTLEARLSAAAAQPVQPEFHLRPNKLVTYKHVAGVMASAQRLGITKIGLIGAEQFLD